MPSEEEEQKEFTSLKNNLHPPPPVIIKKRKNLTIKADEFYEWEKMKGDLSWTALMNKIRTDRQRLLDSPKIVERIIIDHDKNVPTKRVQNGDNVWDDWDMRRGIEVKNISIVPTNKNMMEVLKELKTFDATTLKPVLEEDLSDSYKKMNDRVGIKIR